MDSRIVWAVASEKLQKGWQLQRVRKKKKGKKPGKDNKIDNKIEKDRKKQYTGNGNSHNRVYSY